MQATPRATLLGNARPLADAGLAERYLRFHPEHARYLEIGGFEFWTIEPLQLRFIEGFGSLHWIAADAYLARAEQIAGIEASVIDHMNRDHRDALFAYCAHVHAITPEHVEMIGFDCDGFDLRADGRPFRFALPDPVYAASEARAALVALAERSRR